MSIFKRELIGGGGGAGGGNPPETMGGFFDSVYLKAVDGFLFDSNSSAC